MKKAVFLDRDGVINKVCYHDEKGIYSAVSLKEFVVLPNVKESIGRLKEKGFLIIVVSNQPGVAFGYIKKQAVEEINAFMKKELGIDAVYNCFHHPEFTGECDCRKPKSGMLKIAAEKFGIDLKQSYMIGDNLTDIKAGIECRETFLIARKKSVDLLNLVEDLGIKPTHLAKNLSEAVDIILSKN